MLCSTVRKERAIAASFNPAVSANNPKRYRSRFSGDRSQPTAKSSKTKLGHYPRELEQRRQLAVARVAEGYLQAEVAAFLDVHRSTVSRWVCTARDGGSNALAAKPTPGRPRKLTVRQ